MRMNAIVALVAVNIGLASGIAWLWSDADRLRWTEPPALPPSLEEVPALPAPEPVDVARYRETIERPLFALNRKPAPRSDAAVEAQAAADALKDVRLLGTYRAGDTGGIIVVNRGKVERLAIGDSIGRWKIAGSSEGRSAELVRADGQRAQLDLALNNVPPASAGAGKGSTPATGEARVPGETATEGAPPSSSSGAAVPGGSSSQGEAASSEARQKRLDQLNQRRAASRRSSRPNI